MKPWGGVRAVVAMLAGAGLVWGATETTGTADTVRRSDVRAVTVDTTSGRLTELSLACTGADTGGSVGVTSVPATWLPTTLPGGSVTAQGTTGGDLALEHGGVATAQLPPDVAGRITAKGGLATGLVASQSQVDQRQVSRGLNVSDCSGVTRSGWFLGGGEQQGRVARLTLVNPASTPTTVDASVVGADGVDKAASVAGTVLAPGERKVLTFGDFGSSLAAAAIHVTASGAGVVASLTDAWMTGETPVGEDTVSDPSTPSKRIVIPGVSATDAEPTVRLAVPGKEQAIVRVSAVSTSGAVVADQVKTLQGGASSALELAGLPAGSYSVEVTADVPVVAAVMSRTASTGTTDLTWSTAAPELKGPAGIALPQGVPAGSTSLMLRASSRTTAQVLTVTSSGSSTKTVVIPADRPIITPVADARAVWVRPLGGGALHAAVTVTGHDASGGFLATVPLGPVVLGQATSRLVAARG